MHYIGFKYIIQTQRYMSERQDEVRRVGVSVISLLLLVLSLRQRCSLNQRAKVFVSHVSLHKLTKVEKKKTNLESPNRSVLFVWIFFFSRTTASH